MVRQLSRQYPPKETIQIYAVKGQTRYTELIVVSEIGIQARNNIFC